jgi:hypothetical protein
MEVFRLFMAVFTVTVLTLHVAATARANIIQLSVWSVVDLMLWSFLTALALEFYRGNL